VRALTVLLLSVALACAPAGTDGDEAAAGASDRGPGSVVSSAEPGTGAEEARRARTGVSGTVTDDGGRPLSGVVVVPVSIGRPPTPVPDMTVLTGSDGTYFWVLRPGEYRISTSRPGFQAASKRVRIQEGRTATLNFVIRRRR
jgi:protocatechuate 3,4-dioxygenase beta subunit